MPEVEIIHCQDADEWDRWLTEHGKTRAEAWLKIPRKGAGAPGITADEAGDVALCHGWIDSQRRRLDDSYFIQRYSPRRPGSPWSLINVERVAALEAAGRMRPAGQAQVAAAKADGRWAAAYAPQRHAAEPGEFVAALAGNERARRTYAALGRSERYGLYLPVLKARSPAARERALQRAITTLERMADQGS